MDDDGGRHDDRHLVKWFTGTADGLAHAGNHEKPSDVDGVTPEEHALLIEWKFLCPLEEADRSFFVTPLERPHFAAFGATNRSRGCAGRLPSAPT